MKERLLYYVPLIIGLVLGFIFVTPFLSQPW